MGKLKSTFTSIRHALLGSRVNIYGSIVSIDKKPDGSLTLQLKDETASVDLTIDSADAYLLQGIQVGDVFRCHNLIKSGNSVKFDREDKKMQCMAWDGDGTDFTPKVSTGRSICYVDQKKVVDLRGLRVAEPETDSSSEINAYHERVILAQACGLTIPPVPENLRDRMHEIRQFSINQIPTLTSLSEITSKAITDNLTYDRFFNCFAQVLSVHRVNKGGFVVCVWDGSNVEHMHTLAGTSSLDIWDDMIPYNQPEIVVKNTLNILFYGDSWKGKMDKLKEGDVVLLANAHVNTRALGEKVVAMHEGLEGRRAFVVVPEGHVAANRVTQRCEARLRSSSSPVPPPATSQEETVSTENEIVFSQDTTIQTWVPSQEPLSQLLDPQPGSQMPLEEVDRNSQELTEQPRKKKRKTVTFNLPEEQGTLMVQEEANGDAGEPMEVGKGEEFPESGDVHWVTPSEELEAILVDERNWSLLERLRNRPMSLLPSSLTWEVELASLLQQPPGEVHHFKRALRVNLAMWRMTLHTGMSNMRIGKQVQGDAEGQSLQGDFHILIPVRNSQEAIILAAFPLGLLERLYPSLPSISPPRVEQETSKSGVSIDWMREILEELSSAGFSQEERLFLSASVYNSFRDGHILLVQNALKYA